MNDSTGIPDAASPQQTDRLATPSESMSQTEASSDTPTSSPVRQEHPSNDSAPTTAADSPSPSPQSQAVENTESEPSPGDWLRPSDQKVIGVLALVMLVLMTVHWARLSGWGLSPVEIERHPSQQFEYRIDVNSATWVEWAQLDGIGDVLARRIVEDRKRNGRFDTVDSLTRVKGIGPKTLDRIRPWLITEPAMGPREAAR